MYPFPHPDSNDLWEEISDVNMKASSGTDCTGLIPSASDGEEMQNYSELYDFLPSAIREDIKNQS